MKEVIVPLEIYQDNLKTPNLGVRPTYTDPLIKYGLLPIVVLPGMTEEMIDRLYKSARGIYLTGGEDLDPALYGQGKHDKTNIADKRWDAMEVGLVKRALSDRKPFLGICRGAQILAVASGGKLIQNIPDITNENHNQNKNYDDLLKSKKTKVFLNTKSKIFSLFGKSNIKVSCYHHQSIKNSVPNMIISGKSHEGIAEIIESSDEDYFCFGIQGHIEIEENFLENIFKNFAIMVERN